MLQQQKAEILVEIFFSRASSELFFKGFNHEIRAGGAGSQSAGRVLRRL